MNSEADLVIELYNLNDDLGEQNDIAEQYPEIIKEMEEIVKREHIPSEVFPFLQVMIKEKFVDKNDQSKLKK